MFCDEKTGQFYLVPPHIKFEKKSRLWEQFLEFHENHPEIYENYKNEILKAINQGREIYSISIITEHHRWDRRYKISNNHRAYYARIFVEEFPEYKNFFKFKSIKND
ncbi:MAG TPA: hypothetical protein VNW29_04365 [Candidatus Sulfotelmatobacter sp.]|nr:hypothetical protein [Candidatus Sulfotelmatobacter sp.]